MKNERKKYSRSFERKFTEPSTGFECDVFLCSSRTHPSRSFSSNCRAFFFFSFFSLFLLRCATISFRSANLRCAKKIKLKKGRTSQRCAQSVCSSLRIQDDDDQHSIPRSSYVLHFKLKSTIRAHKHPISRSSCQFSLLTMRPHDVYLPRTFFARARCDDLLLFYHNLIVFISFYFWIT